jgi:hypothetical protein
MERCRQEIAAIEAEIRAGNPDLQGLCLALADWYGELRLLRRGRGVATVAQPLARVRSGSGVLAYGKDCGDWPCGHESGSEAEKPAAAEPGGQERRDSNAKR